MAQNILKNFSRELPKEPSLFQNLSTDLAEVVKSLFLFIALAAILFDVAESFEQFWKRVNQETFLYNYFKIHLFSGKEVV